MANGKHINMALKIHSKKIGKGYPVFVVAEMSGNHNKSFKRALKIIDAAADAGADAVKLQTYTPDTITMKSNKKLFKIGKGSVWSGKTLYDLYKSAYTPWEWQPKLKKYAEKKGLLFFSTPFDETSVDFLEKMRVLVYKIASFEIIDTELLKKIGKTKKPVIVSRGMATEKEIKQAIRTLKQSGSKQIAVLHCVSAYPAKIEEMNLVTIPDISKKFNVVSGLSDHSLGISASIASVVLGASIIEKHLTLKRSDGGPDSGFSLEPKEFSQLVKSVREVESAIGKPTYRIVNNEKSNVSFRRSIFVVKDMKKGEKFTKVNVRSIRPGFGMDPSKLHSIFGRSASCDIPKGSPLNNKLID